METILQYAKAFLVGGMLCLVGQILIDRTRLTPARILTSYVVAGVVLGALGLYQPIADFAGAGASVPLTGFGNLLAKGVREAVSEKGLIGAFTGWDRCRGGRYLCSGVFRAACRTAVPSKGKEMNYVNQRGREIRGLFLSVK